MDDSLGQIVFSVLTPTWNREVYLDRVYRGLVAQTFRGFEWVVADDGSTDGTADKVRALTKHCDFPVLLIRANRHVGKAVMDNAAVREARGRFILWCDSDDVLAPQALKRLWETWQSIPLGRRGDFVGLTGLAETAEGCIADPFPGQTSRDVSWNDLSQVHHVSRDMLFCARATTLKAYPFPEVDFVVPESVVWSAIGHGLTRLIAEPLKLVEYGAPHAVSFDGTMSYNRGRAFALAATTKNLKKYESRFSPRFWRTIKYLRYCVHGELSFQESVRLWNEDGRTLILLLCLPFALALVAKDRLEGKVRRTHREFARAIEHAEFTIEHLSTMG
jgi:glycosyltransferase involved in cell wall biosynthesis